MIIGKVVIIMYATLTLTSIGDELWNATHPRPFPVKDYQYIQWEKKDFIKMKDGSWLLRPKRKTDTKIKKYYRDHYYKKMGKKFNKGAKMYYNTNEEKGTELKNSRQKAKTQEEIILDIFQRNPKFHMTPFDIQAALNSFHNMDAPITSVRRAMTDLTTNNQLTKTDIMRKGKYGKDVHCWKLKMQ